MTAKLEDIYPLTPVQEGMLFHTLNSPGDGYYFQQSTISFKGRLDVDAFQMAWQDVVSTHSILRASFAWEEIEHPVQIIHDRIDLKWTVLDWSHIPLEEISTELDKFLTQDRQTPIDFSQPPMMRMALIHFSGSRSEFVWTLHHSLLDGWSIQVLIQNVIEAYRKITIGQRLNGVPKSQFRDYIAWRQQHDFSVSEKYWRQLLVGFNASVELRFPLEEIKELGLGEYYREETRLSAELTSRLESIAQQHRITINTIFQGAWAFLLNRYSGRSDIVYGTTMSGRPTALPNVFEIAGPFLSTLPVRVLVSLDQPIHQWLQSIQKQLSATQEHSTYSPSAIQSLSEMPPGRALYDSIFVFENYPKAGQKVSNSLEILNVEHHGRSHYPLAFCAVPDKEARLVFFADSEKYSKAALHRLLDHVKDILDAMSRSLDGLVGDLPMISRSDRMLIEKANSAKKKATTEKTWLELFEQSVRHSAAKTAIVCGETSLTYAEVDEQANRLATRLVEKSPSNRLVAIGLPRCVESIVAIVAVHKAGFAYVPIDVEYPAPRIAQMIEKSDVQIVVTDGAGRAKFSSNIDVIDVASASDVSVSSEPTISTNPSATDLAYVIFTSGSTGSPNGVMVTHGNLLHSTRARIDYYREPVDTFLLLSSISFDSSVAGIFWALSTGGTLCIPTPFEFSDPLELQQLIERHRVSHLLCIPSLYQELLRSGAEGRLSSLVIVISAGEALTPRLIHMHFDRLPSARLYNEYGPTEATVWCSVEECSRSESTQIVSIGKAIGESQLHVLDADQNEVPIGCEGELFVGGPGLARGYLNDEELTKQRFIHVRRATDSNVPSPSPAQRNSEGEGRVRAGNFSSAARPRGERLYRTGDLAKFDPSGDLIFLGRIDSQVKLRGYRIELGEIEQKLLEFPAVNEAIAMICQSADVVGMDDAELNERLETMLAALPNIEAERMLRQVKSKEASLSSGSIHRRREKDFELTLNVTSNQFISPPRKTQREWLISQAVNEWKDDLEHLHRIAKTFAPGTESSLAEFDISETRLSEQEILENWQVPLMEAMAKCVTESHGDVLEIGFGRGVASTFLQQQGVRSHTIIEMNEHCIKDFYKPWVQEFPDREIHLIQGRWQDVLDRLETYDGVFFHAFPMNDREFFEYVVDSITFAEHFFPVAAKLLRPGGTFTYMTLEIDSLSRRHQRALFRNFREVTVSVQPLSVPSDTKDTWWADSIVVAKATVS